MKLFITLVIAVLVLVIVFLACQNANLKNNFNQGWTMAGGSMHQLYIQDTRFEEDRVTQSEIYLDGELIKTVHYEILHFPTP